MATVKQKLVVANLVENGGNLGKAMVAVGYSPATAKTPQKLTESKGWQQLMDKYLPDTLLAMKHKQLLNARQTIVVGIGDSKRAVATKYPDHTAVAKALEIAYKLKGYSKDKSDLNIHSDQLDETLDRISALLPDAGD